MPEDMPVAQTVPGEFEIPSTLVNFAQVTYNPLGVRITWGESPDASPKNVHWRNSHFVPMNIFPSLVQLLDETLAQIQKMQRSPDAKDN